ncbi:MAG: hypothetical protein GKC10_01140 [Methanosarcinales archaeon]|nr:hypothetical protein [Methanosarcinales archaeon]
MRAIALLIMLLLLAAQGDGRLESGVKVDGAEDIVLVGADDWHSSVAATPLAIWREGNETVTRPLLILPREVRAGDRMGWVEQADLDRYGVSSVLHTLSNANVTSLVIHGSGDLTRSMVEAAQKEGIRAYVTVTLEPETESSPAYADIASLAVVESAGLGTAARDMFFQEMGLNRVQPSPALEGNLQKINPTLTSGLAVDSSGGKGGLLCPVDPEVREELYNRVEELIDDYKVDGVVLYSFGFENEEYCFCDVCKETFYQDTGIDLTKIYSSNYNLQRWKGWREEKVQEMVRDVRNVTNDLGPVSLGVAIESPLDRSQGYNYANLARISDFAIITPVSADDVGLAAGMTATPLYVRLSDDYVEYTISTQNVQGTVKYIEDLVGEGAAGLAFEYSVVYTPLWSELEPPSNSARWLLDHLQGMTLGVGDVFWNCDERITSNSSPEVAARISDRWESSPGAVLVGENYSLGLRAASIASYLNWPVLFVGPTMPNETLSSLQRLGASQVVLVGPASGDVKSRLDEQNITIMDGKEDFILAEMEERGEELESIVLVNSRDLSLMPPRPATEIKRASVDDIFFSIEMTPSRVPADSAGEIVRLNISLTNTGDDIEDLKVVDLFPSGRYVRMPTPLRGQVNITDPSTGEPSTPDSAFFQGAMMLWTVGDLKADESAYLNLEIEILHPLDSGWTQPLDSGITVSPSSLEENLSVEVGDDWPITNITYPARMPVGIAHISWNVAKTPSYTGLYVVSPDGREGTVTITDVAPDKTYRVAVPLAKPGIWTFRVEAGNGFTHVSDNYTIDVRSSISPLNITAFGLTRVPRLSLVAAQVAAARSGLLVDVGQDPQDVEPLKVEESLQEKVKKLKVVPKYLIVVGDPGSMPFISTGAKQNLSELTSYDIFRDYKLQLDDDNYSEVATGRIIGLSVYDASQMVARSQAYDRLQGSWRDNGLVITTPADWPWNPIPLWIRDYLRAAGLNVRDLRWEEATFQRVSSMMNNGMNVVHFDHHGTENAWGLSYWALMDSALDETQVKQLVLAPQTTTSNACLTSRLKGLTINVGGTEMYVPMRLEDSMALAFIRAGAVNYMGSGALSWIFISDDHSKRFYQALAYENATVGQALLEADNLYLAKARAARDIGSMTRFDEVLPMWENSVEEMVNQTSSEFMLFGDPAFRPSLANTPELPYRQTITSQTEENATGRVELSLTPTSEMGTDWLYWIIVESTDGELFLNAPPVLMGQVMLPADAEEIVVKESGRAVWHEEDLMGEHKRVIWPAVRPRLNETREFSVQYRIIPGEVQTVNISAGWNMVSLHLQPKDASVTRYLKNKPYRGVFSITGEGWTYRMTGSDDQNLTRFEPGEGYLIDSSEDFSFEVSGKPVELPFRVRLHEGWNMIGVPVNQTVYLNNITVNAEHKRYSYQEAVSRGLVSAFTWIYTSEGEWVHLDPSEPLQPGMAYLVEAMKECRLEFRGESS